MEENLVQRRYQTAQQIEDEYVEIQAQTASLLSTISDRQMEQERLPSWKEPDLTLAGFVQQLSRHSQDHCQQIADFREKRAI